MEETAVSFAMHKLGVGNTQVVYSTSFSSDITDHVYLSQVHVSGKWHLSQIALICFAERDSICKCRCECSYEGRQGRRIWLLLR